MIELFHELKTTVVNAELRSIQAHQPVQLHTFYARLLVFDKTLAQPHFAAVIALTR